MMKESLAKPDLQIINEVMKKVFANVHVGIDLSELNLLDDINASKTRILELGMKIAAGNPEIMVAILGIARSVHTGYVRRDEVIDFYDAVMRLGADRTKLFILSLSMFSSGKGPEARQRAAKSASIAILGRLIAGQMRLGDDLVRKVESGGLLCQLGENVFLKARNIGMDISDEFIQRHRTHLAILLAEKLNLDPFLRKAVDMAAIEVDTQALTLVGIIKLAEALTEDSFSRCGKLIVRFSGTAGSDTGPATPVGFIKKLFVLLGVEVFLEVREAASDG
jgi:hypothetical protein